MISIIIPLHNLGSKGDYCLKKCLDSIVEQTYTDFEVLLMENGSTDNTVDIAKEYCSKDNRLKLHILDKIGISNARNKGIEFAIGEYITFIDGDDYISVDYLDSLYSAYTINDNIELATCPVMLYYVKTNKQKPLPFYYSNRILDVTKKYELFTNATVWGNLYSKYIINKYNIKFDTQLFGVDDTLFLWEYYLCVNYISITDKGTYYYIQGRKGQTTYNKIQKMAENIVILNQKLYELFLRYGKHETYKNILDYSLVNFFIGRDFASSFLIKMPISYINETIEIFKDRLYNIELDPMYCADWQIKWFKRFIYFTKRNSGAFFLKFMRIYRNIILSPLGIKYKGKIVHHS